MLPEGAISLESIFVSVRSTSLAGEDEDVGLASGGTDSALPLAAVDLMKVLFPAKLLANYKHAGISTLFNCQSIEWCQRYT
ncbi:MAG: hypothetical protein ACI9DC_005258 [Gammaproteobacteria bacterium]